MIKRKCPGCAEKIEKRFSFCPWCGHSIKEQKEKDNFGLFGRTDNNDQQMINQNMPIAGLPFGLEKMMGPLIKQLEKELSNLDNGANMPKGFNIKIQTGMPNKQARQVSQYNQNKPVEPQLSREESARRQKLPKVETESKVKRLSDKILYELKTPGVRNQADIAITKLENGYEVKAFSKDKCFIKTIPFKMDIIGFRTDGEKTILEFKEE